MAARKNRTFIVTDNDTAEVLGTIDEAKIQPGPNALEAAVKELAFPEKPLFETPEEAIRAIVKQRAKLDKAEKIHADAKGEVKAANEEVEKEASTLTMMQRALNQMKLFRALILIALMLFVPACGDLQEQGAVGGSVGGWDDSVSIADDFEVLDVEPGVAILFNKRTQKAWILAGSTAHQHVQSWNAITPIP